MNAGEAQWAMAFQISPIVLTGGIASNMPGGALPIIAITEAESFTDGLLSGPDNIRIEDYFASFEPAPGANLIKQEVATYPFANQAIAANATIAMPLEVSLIMKCPARTAGGYLSKLNTLMALQAALADHNNQGGTYTVATPSFFYDNLLLRELTDVTPGDSLQPQTHWQWMFFKPLLTQQEAQQAQNSLMSKIGSGTQVNGDNPTWSGTSNTIGQPPSLATPSIIPAASSSSAVANPPPFN